MQLVLKERVCSSLFRDHLWMHQKYWSIAHEEMEETFVVSRTIELEGPMGNEN